MAKRSNKFGNVDSKFIVLGVIVVFIIIVLAVGMYLLNKQTPTDTGSGDTGSDTGSGDTSSNDISSILEEKTPPLFACVGGDGFIYTTPSIINKTVPWTGTGKGLFKCLIKLQNGKFAGVGTDNQVWLSSTSTLQVEDWFKQPNSGDVICIVQLKDGTFAGVGTNNVVHTSPSLTNVVWTNTGKGPVKWLTQLNDGTFAAVGMDNSIFTTPNLIPNRDPFASVNSPSRVFSVSQLKDGTIAGIGLDSYIWTASSINASVWGQQPNTCCCVQVIQVN